MAYLIHSSILLAAFVAFYWLLLRKETFYKLNRWIFLIGIFCCLALPLVTVPASLSLRAAENSQESAIAAIDIPILENPKEEVLSNSTPKTIEQAGSTLSTPSQSDTNSTSSGLTVASLLQYLYFSGVAIFLAVFLLQLIVLLARKYTLNSVRAGKYEIVELVKDHEPYSFLNSIFINPNNYDRETYEHIFEHEKVHVDQVHFFDKILAEMLVIFFWFNPFVWVLRNVLSENLEFLTDHSLLQKGLPKESYQLSLLKVSTSTKPFNLTNSYNNSFLKNRILMMNSKKSSITSFWKYLFILPLFLLSLMSLNAVQSDAGKAAPLSLNAIGQSIPQKAQPQKSSPENSKPVAQPKAPQAPQTPDTGNGAAITNPPVRKKQNKTSNSTTSTSNSNSLAIENNSIKLPAISSIRAADDITVYIKQGSRQKVKIDGPTSLIDQLNTEVRNGFWDISFDKNFKSGNRNKSLRVYLTVEKLNSIICSGAARVIGEGQFTNTDKFEIHGNGAGIVDIAFSAPKSEIHISGACRISLSGKSDHVATYISGSGSLQAVDLISKKSKVHVSGAGSVGLTVKDEIDAVISGAGSVRYKGNPKIHRKISGDGSISRI